MAKEEDIELMGTVVQQLPNAQFKVRIDEFDKEILTYICGKIRKNYIRILEGDRVKVKICAYDPDKGIIKYREKN